MSLSIHSAASRSYYIERLERQLSAAVGPHRSSDSSSSGSAGDDLQKSGSGADKVKSHFANLPSMIRSTAVSPASALEELQAIGNINKASLKIVLPAPDQRENPILDLHRSKVTSIGTKRTSDDVLSLHEQFSLRSGGAQIYYAPHIS
ncbi:hypothetical protein TAMA11512_23010 [Selenomonas sp. TAMA-11512]|uniref:hypothetical protein n=1 Tax=Selenomonas sp. TAMA-11512 TaxID=3095337 RepID=UPI003091BF98|nr:hypothetical protein TAMA11512_23010 [Selenomonas sp. TAMA-11512]